MASPTPSADDRKNLEQITFRFCSECSNMLYPKEDPDTHRLNFACRTCQYSEEAVSSCVFRNVLNNAVGETAGVTQDVGSDPTVSYGFLWALGLSGVKWEDFCEEGVVLGLEGLYGPRVDGEGSMGREVKYMDDEMCLDDLEEVMDKANGNHDGDKIELAAAET
jgi:DNA-directed RNA polymerase subunit M/transcription elongation factor TFIIS